MLQDLRSVIFVVTNFKMEYFVVFPKYQKFHKIWPSKTDWKVHKLTMIPKLAKSWRTRSISKVLSELQYKEKKETWEGGDLKQVK